MIYLSVELVIVAIAFVFNFLISVLPYYVLSFLRLGKLATSWLYWNNRVLSCFIFKIIGLKLNVSVSDKAKELINSKQAVCYVSNHTSMLDIPAIVCASKDHVGFVAKDVLKKTPFVNLLAFAMRCVFINRSNHRDSINGIKHGAEILASGHSMIIFPEGTRSKTGELAPFKMGSFRLAEESQVPIIPVTLQGLRAAVEDRKRLFGKYQAYAILGEPVYMPTNNDRDARFDKIKSIENSIRETYASLGDKNV